MLIALTHFGCLSAVRCWASCPHTEHFRIFDDFQRYDQMDPEI